jgi:myo-inositol 2-dehydrogenase / D-chiro-inositol 1-dehydrogenase
MTVNIGLVGTGRMGRIHIENLMYRVPGARLEALTDINRASAEKCARDFQVPHVAQDLDEILENKDIHAVAICSSTDTHAPMIIAAARAGKHIFCEKPIALDLASIDLALKAVEMSGVKLMVGFNRRYHSNFKKIKELVAAGKVGRPHLVRITSRDSAPPSIEYVRVSGGIFLDMTIHDFDMARYLVDGEVTEVFASGSVLINPAIGEAGDVDTAVVVMNYENGAICTIDNSREAVYGYDQRVEVFGSGGLVTCSNKYPDSVVNTTKESTYSSLPYFSMIDIYRETYVDELIAFVRAVEHDTVPPITGKDGRIPLVMGLAAGRSLRERRSVKLSEIG